MYNLVRVAFVLFHFMLSINGKYILNIERFKSILIIFNSAFTQLDIKQKSTKHGFVFPNRAEPNKDITFVLEGADFLIYLTKVPEDFTTCQLTSPDISLTYVLNSASSDPK